MRIRVFPAAIGILILVFVMSFFSTSGAQPSLVLTGKVVSKSSRQPVSSVWVEVIKNGERVGRSLTGDDGNYYISGLEKGSYEVVVVRQGRELCKRTLQLIDSQRFDIEL